MKEVEAVIGPLQMLKREESEMDALTDEVQSNIDHDDHMTHECIIEGHDHPPPFPLLNAHMVIHSIIFII